MDKEYMRRWRAKKVAAGLCTSCGVVPVSGTVRCGSCKERRKELRKRYKKRGDLRQRIRGKVMEALGWKCACCGETLRSFLTLDHSKDDGKRERKESLNLAMLRGILKGARPDIQILCWNCNMGRAKNSGICPHREAKTAPAPAALPRAQKARFEEPETGQKMQVLVRSEQLKRLREGK